nr:MULTISPECIES: hypothetical protein [unclassified Roseofilum]
MTIEIKTEDYNVYYDDETKTISFEGSLRLSGMDEYAPIVQILEEIAEQKPPVITLNLRNLEFLNSSGISMLSKFVIKIRQKKEMAMVVKGSKGIPWQGKSLKNLQRLMPSLTLELEELQS